jgi:hypothetical protein
MKSTGQVNMKKECRISQIIDISAPEIISGEETVDSILEKYPQYALELRPRLEAVLWLTDTQMYLDPHLGFITSSRGSMERQIETIQPQTVWQHLIRRYTPQRWAFNLITPVILVLLLALIINNLLLTARLSIPGDPLYSTKLSIEDIQLALTFSPVEKTELYMQFTRERTIEIVDLAVEKKYSALTPTAARMETEIIASLHSLNDLTYYDPNVEQTTTALLRETLSNEIYILNIMRGFSTPSAYQGIELAIQAAQSGISGLH